MATKDIFDDFLSGETATLTRPGTARQRVKEKEEQRDSREGEDGLDRFLDGEAGGLPDVSDLAPRRPKKREDDPARTEEGERREVRPFSIDDVVDYEHRGLRGGAEDTPEGHGLVKGAAKGFARAGLQTATDLAEWIMANQAERLRGSVAFSEEQREEIDELADMFDEGGVQFGDWSAKVIEERLPVSPELEDKLFQPDNPKYWAERVLGEGVGSFFFPAVVGLVTRSPVATSVAVYSQMAAPTYNEARAHWEEEGLDRETAHYYATVEADAVGALGAAAGYVPAKALFGEGSRLTRLFQRGLRNQIAARMAAGGTAEAAAEPVQEFVQDLGAMIAREDFDRMENALERYAHSSVTGAAAGGVTGAPAGVQAYVLEAPARQQRRVDEAARQLNEEARAREGESLDRVLDDYLSRTEADAAAQAEQEVLHGRLSETVTPEVAARLEEQRRREAEPRRKSFQEVLPEAVEHVRQQELDAGQLRGIDRTIGFILSKPKNWRARPGRIESVLRNTVLDTLPDADFDALVGELMVNRDALMTFREGLQDVEPVQREGVPREEGTEQPSRPGGREAATEEGAASRERARAVSPENSWRLTWAEWREESRRAGRNLRTARRQHRQAIRDAEARGEDVPDSVKVPYLEAFAREDAAAERADLERRAEEGDREAQDALMRMEEESGVEAGFDPEFELMSVVGRVGLPTPEVAAGFNRQGEVAALQEHFSRTDVPRFFTTRQRTETEILEQFAEQGHRFESMDDLMAAVENRVLSGRPVYGQAPEMAAPFARRRPARPRSAEELGPRIDEWEARARRLAPGVMGRLDLELAKPEALVEAGLVRPEDLTGREQAAYDSQRRILYLMDEAFRRSPDDVTRLNIQHEMGHAFWDTLPAERKAELRDLWRQETTDKTGPLYQGGRLRRNVSEDVEAGGNVGLREWFAERLAHANDSWAKRRMEDAPGPDAGLFERVSWQFRETVRRMAEYLEQIFPAEQIVRDFRRFLDQGDRWAEPRRRERPGRGETPARPADEGTEPGGQARAGAAEVDGAPAEFLGFQEMPPGQSMMELWNLTEPVGRHPANSTVTRETLENEGYSLPEPPDDGPVFARRDLSPDAIPDFVPDDTRGIDEGELRFRRQERAAESVLSDPLETGAAIDPWWKSFLKARGLFESASDNLRRSPELRFLADAIDRHMDQAEAYRGALGAYFRPQLKKIRKLPRRERQEVFESFSRYWAAKENGREIESAGVLRDGPDLTRQLIAQWRAVAAETGEINQAAGVQVFDPRIEGYRPIGRVQDFFPRMLRKEVQRVLRKPSADPALWNQLVDALLAEGHIQERGEAVRYLNDYFPQETANDHFSSIEKARQQPLPEIFYNYDFDAVIEYINRWGERMAQIEAYGQKLGEQGKDAFDRAMELTRDEETKSYISRVRDRAYRVTPTDPFRQWIGNLNLLATALQLGNPATATLNLVSGAGYNFAAYGIGPGLRGLREMWNFSQSINEAHERGVLQNDFLNLMRDAEGVETSVGGVDITAGLRTFARTMMQWGGYTPTEKFIRTHGLMTGKSFLRSALRTWNKEGMATHRSKSYAALFQRNGFDVEALLQEDGAGRETDRFLRYAPRLTQGSYRIDMVPVYTDTPEGRFLFKYQKFGTQMNRMFWMNHLKPFVESLAGGERVTYRGPEGQLINGRVATFVPLLRFFAVATAAGSGVAILRDALFGYPVRGASLEEMEKALENDERSRALSLLMERAWHSLNAAGGLGFFGNYGQFFADVFDRQRVKNPLDPPGLAAVKSASDLGMTYAEQGTLTARDMDNAIEHVFSAYRTGKRMSLGGLEAVGSDVREARLYSANRDLRKTRGIIRRYADYMGIENKMRATGRFARTEMSPVNRRINEALMLGDGARAAQIAQEHLETLRTEDEIRRAWASMQSSVRARQPIRVLQSAGEVDRLEFLLWAEENLGPNDLEMVRRIDSTYRDAAQTGGFITEMDRRRERQLERRLRQRERQREELPDARRERLIGDLTR